MLTRELLLYRIRAGVLRPTFVDPTEPALRALATDLVALMDASIGHSRERVEESFGERAQGFPREKVARGLVKLLLDRAEFEEPGEEAALARRTRLAEAAQVLRALPPTATLEDYETHLAARWPEPLPRAREALYADLPPRRRLLAWRPLTAPELLDRYNLALAQGPLLSARSLTLRAYAPELLRVRKVLRWLKLCRLVAELRREGEDWTLEIEGPAAVLAMQKRYGLELASFLTAVPVLERWEVTAEVQAGRRRATLSLDHRAPLVSPHPKALGYVPPEVEAFARGFEEDGTWALDLTPLPRPTGATGLCVPDLTLRHRETGREVAVELFHPWHAGALTRRLDELRSRPDPSLLLGVDRALARAPQERAPLERHPQVFLFSGFPSAARLREKLGP